LHYFFSISTIPVAFQGLVMHVIVILQFSVLLKFQSVQIKVLPYGHLGFRALLIGRERGLAGLFLFSYEHPSVV